jgi:hypothetical protein
MVNEYTRLVEIQMQENLSNFMADFNKREGKKYKIIIFSLRCILMNTYDGIT